MDTEMEFEAFSNLTNIQNFFYGQSIFLTGVTGLVGKVVLEKILRCCPGVGMIYIHLRPKKGLTLQQRLEKLFKLELFREVKDVFPLFWKRVQIVEGDITHNRLGLSLDDFEKIRQNVSIVLHSAASVNFNDPIKISVEHNVIATQRVLELCHEMPHIKAMIHLSTSYVKREDDASVLEEIPECKVDPEKLIDALQWMDDKSQEAVENFLIQDKMGNLTTYLVTKALAEVLIEKKKGDLPIGVVRPCYIGPTWKAPFPGWIDTLQGISGLFLAGAKGVLRALQAVEGLKISLIPVDVVASAVLTSAWHVGTSKPSPIFIINCVMDYDTLPKADQDILNFVLEKRQKYPLVNIFRYPDFTIYYNSFAYKLHCLFQQWIPAFIIDVLLFIFTGKTILVKVYSKISFLYSIFYRLGKDPWIFKRDNYVALQNKLSEEDEKIFSMNLDNFDWHSYLDDCLKGGRQFLAREDPSNLPYAKKKAKIWLTVTTVLKWFLILYFVYYLFTRSFFSPLYKSFEEAAHILHT